METEPSLNPPHDASGEQSPARWRRPLLLGAIVVLLLGAGLVYEIFATAPVRGAVRACTELFNVANRPDLSAEERIAQALGSAPAGISRPTSLTSPATARGSSVSLRNINKNFQAWRHGAHIWICPTDRVGPVYQFVLEDGSWRFDGPVGLLRPHAEFVPMKDLPDPE